jgi:hypothetical protein
VIGLIAVALALGDAAITRSNPPRASLAVYNRTTSTIAFDTADGRALRTYALPCSQVDFDLAAPEWHLRGTPVPAPASDDAPFVDVSGVIPPYPGALPEKWRIVISPEGMTGGLVPPAGETLPPCDGPPRTEVIHLSGSGSAELGTHRLAGAYRLALKIIPPAISGCDFAAVAEFASGLHGGYTPTFLSERIVYQAVDETYDRFGFQPAEYDLSVQSSCPTWDIVLTPH